MMVDSEQTDSTQSSGPEPPEAGPPETEPKSARPGRDRSGRRKYREGPVEDNAGWTIFSYLLAGMAFYGLVGWVVSRVTHIAVLFPLGAITGLVLAIVLIIFKYGRP